MIAARPLPAWGQLIGVTGALFIMEGLTLQPRAISLGFNWWRTPEGTRYWEAYAESTLGDAAFAVHRARLCQMYFELTGQKPVFRVKAQHERQLGRAQNE